MSRPVLIAIAIWLAAAVLLVVGGATGIFTHLPNAYLCGWLVLVSLPLGALPVLMALELTGARDAGLAAPLRLILACLPILALLFVPLLINLRGAYTWQACVLSHCPTQHYEGLGARWFTPGFFALRRVGYLVVWIALSLYFLRPALTTPSRRALAAIGLMLHLVLGSLAAFDWFMSLDEGLVSSNYGVLVMAAQCAFAVTTALLMSLSGSRTTPDRNLVLALLVVIGVAAFAQFVEYLVVWSANLPKEIAWYQERATGGRLFAVVAPLLLLCGAVILMPRRLGSNRMVVGLALGAFCLVEVIDIVLLASPNGLFAPGLVPDLLMIVVLGGVAVVFASILGGRARHTVWHG